MAEFECKVYKLEILPHPNADVIELAKVGDYLSIVKKGDFQTGDLGVYIPEAAICPNWLIVELGLEGKLAGKDKNRVKAIKLRGILSQGLIYPMSYDTSYQSDSVVPVIFNDKGERWEANEGDVVNDFLGITKWEPPIPVHMAGEVWNAHGYTLKYDIENFKKYPSILQEGEPVVMTEKIHGTWCCFGYHPEHRESHIITSKGLSAQGLAFKVNEANANNLYIRALDSTARYPDGTGGNALDRMHAFLSCDINKWGLGVAFYILGEVYGKGVQDLTYGADKPRFRAFDIYIGPPGQGRYLDYAEFVNVCQYVGIERVPTLYNGPFSKEKMLEMTDGMESVSGNAKNIREGIVIKPIHERNDYELGRVILKSVSEKYLLRKDGTEYN